MLQKIQASGFPIILSVLFLLVSLFGYAGLAWWIEPGQTKELALFLIAACSGYAFWWFNRTILSWSTILIVAVVFRAIFLLDDTTRLSNDAYRFIWDAEQVTSGVSPYLYTPEEWSMQNSGTIFDPGGELYQHIDARDQYSTYPPVCQFFWSTSSWLAHLLDVPDSIGHRIIFLKMLYFIVEIITMLLLVSLLIKKGLAGQLAGIYALNPLVIIELTGNLHPEAIMILFLAIASMLALSNRMFLAAIPFGFAISTKFVPLLFIPFLVKRYGWKNTIIFGTISVQVAALVFIPFLSENLIHHVSQSLALYFTSFEFNASLYFIVRNIMEELTGFQYMMLVGPLLALAAFFAIFIVLVKQRSTMNALLAVYFIYIISATAVHPWYLTIPVLLGVFGTYRWPLVASCAVLVSYFLYIPGTEHFWIILAEYTVIIAAFAVDVMRPRQKQPKLHSSW